MIRKCIKKLDGIIQWSKRFYFAHFFVWLTWFANILYITLILIFYGEGLIQNIIEPNSIILKFTSSDLEGFLAFYLLYFPLFSGYVLLVIIPATFLIMLIKFALSRKFTVTSKYLLDNKKYNIFYIIGLIYSIVIWIFLLATQVGIYMLSLILI